LLQSDRGNEPPPFTVKICLSNLYFMPLHIVIMTTICDVHVKK